MPYWCLGLDLGLRKRFEPRLRTFAAALALVVCLLPVPATSQVVANPGDNKTVDGQTIATTTPNTPALWAAGGTITGTGTTISTTGDGSGPPPLPGTSDGAFATAGGQITLTNSSISTIGIGAAYGLHTQDAGSNITIENTTVSTTGIGVHGALIGSGSSIKVTGGSITASGAGADAVAVAGTFTGTNTTLTTNADSTTSVLIFASTTPGDPGGTVILNGTSVVNNGANGFGIVTNENTSLTMMGGSITTTKDGTTAIGPSGFPDTGSVTQLTGVTVETSGAAAHGILTNGTSVSFTNSTMTLHGSGVFGVAALANGAATTINVSGSTITTPNGIALAAEGTSANINVSNGSVVTGGTGGLLRVKHYNAVSNPALATVTADNSTLTGDITVDGAAANTLNAVLQNNATLTGNINVDATNGAFADLAVQSGATFTGATQSVRNLTTSGGTWNVTADSNVTGTLTNGGVVAFTGGGPFKTLTTTNYVGNGGTLGVNTALGSDGSPTDQLIINGGTATGTTGIVVTNQGGTGALTTGNGIPIVLPTGGATIDAGAFGTNGSVVPGAAAGPYQYLLFQGTGGDTTYYLRSHLDVGPGPTPEPTPIYRPDVSIHSVLAGMSRQQGLATLGTFHDRNGDQRLAGSAGNRTAAWGRLFGETMEQSHSGTVNAHLDGNMGGLQAGVDAMQWTSASGHQDRFGLFAAYARTTGDVSGHALGIPNRIAGRAELDGTSFGGYWTHLAPTGWYTDTVLMGTRFNGDGHSVVGSDLDVKGYGVTASVEGGYPIPIAPGVRLEPQGQLVYSHVNIDDVHDPSSYVAYDTPDALFGRLGLRLSADMLPLPMVLRPYLKANVWQDFTETDTIRFANVHEIESRHRATTLELGGGVIWQLSSNAGLWFDAGYTTDIGGPDEREAVRGTAGLRVTW